jgi:hypothetical protein
MIYKTLHRKKIEHHKHHSGAPEGWIVPTSHANLLDYMSSQYLQSILLELSAFTIRTDVKEVKDQSIILIACPFYSFFYFMIL